MNNKKITGLYRIGLLISFISIIFTAIVVWEKPLTWFPEVSPVFVYCFALCFPVVDFLVVLGLQFMDVYYRKKYDKTEDEEERAGIVSADRVGAYTVIFLSVEFFAMWLGILYVLMPSAMKLDDGETGEFLADLFKLLAVILSIMYIFLGNYMPLCRRKGLGFTCKWSDSNESVRYKTNRYAGKVFVIAGLISTFISIAFNGYIGMGTMIVTLIVALTVCSKKAKEYYLEEVDR